MIKNILILVGGKGKRLGNLTKNTPKPLLQFNNKVFLDYIINNLLPLNVKKIYLLCCYKSNLFFKRYHNKIFNNTKIICIKEPQNLGTGGSINYSKKLILSNTLICNGDTYMEYNFKKLQKIKIINNCLVIGCIKNSNYKSNKKLNNIKINNKSKITFKKSSKLMNSGIYIVNKNFKKLLNKNIISFEDDLVEKLIKEKKVYGFKIKNYSLDIGTKKNYNKFAILSKKLNSKFFSNSNKKVL